MRARWIPLTLALILLGTGGSSAGQVVVVDAGGRRIEVNGPFRRIVSLYSAHTENLFSLGLADEIVGVSRSETHPPAALEKPSYSHRADVERILAAEPDLVLIRPMIDRGYPVFVERLEGAGVAVVSLQPRGPREMYAYWRALGALTGREAEAEAMVRTFREGLEAIRRKLEQAGRRQVVYFESIHRHMKTFSPRSIAMFALERAGGVNAATDAEAVNGSNIAAYGKEAILARGPEIDAFLAQRGVMNDITEEAIRSEPGFGAIRGVREGRVHVVAEELVSRPTPRLLEGIREIARFLYPEVFSGDAG